MHIKTINLKKKTAFQKENVQRKIYHHHVIMLKRHDWHLNFQEQILHKILNGV